MMSDRLVETMQQKFEKFNGFHSKVHSANAQEFYISNRSKYEAALTQYQNDERFSHFFEESIDKLIDGFEEVAKSLKDHPMQMQNSGSDQTASIIEDRINMDDNQEGDGHINNFTR
eukprot:Pgem_evm1s15892